MRSNKKGGVVTSTVMGIGGLIIAVIVMLVLTQTLSNANLFENSRASTTRLDQTITAFNETGSVYGNDTLSDPTCSIDTIFNNTIAVPTSNFTTDNCLVKFTGTANDGFNNKILIINSTTTYDGETETSVNNLRSNMSTGINNVGNKIPIILTIVAVVFLFGALVLLMRSAKQMGVGGGGSL